MARNALIALSPIAVSKAAVEWDKIYLTMVSHSVNFK